MRNLKKFLALILAMMMTFSLMATVNASSFKDDEDITKAYNEAVDVLTGLKVIQGYEDKTFQPKANITRGEVAAILYRIVTGDVSGSYLYLYRHETVFKDVYATDWYAPYVNYCENNGLIEGVGNNMFLPNADITGYEALTMILRAIGYDNRNEYRPTEWKKWASGWGSRLGITKQIADGSLGAAATREVVAEIMFQGIQAPMVSYTILNQYTPILLVDASEINAQYGDPAKTDTTGKIIYKADVAETLMHQTFGIVGKSSALTFDKFGRPTVMWVKDKSTDTVKDGTKYIINSGAAITANQTDPEGKDQAKVSLSMTPVKTYTDAVTECQLTKDINKDESIPWGSIVEVLNGNQTEPTTDAGNTLTGVHTATLDKRADALLDALHTTTKYIGATGRTTEIYKLDQKVWTKDADGTIVKPADGKADPDNHTNSNLWVFVYIDTFLAEVVDTTPAIKDSAGHVIQDATATVHLGNTVATGNELVEIILTMDSDDEYEKGELALVQSWGGGAGTAIDTIDTVDSPEKAPLEPDDVPNEALKFLTAAKAKLCKLTGAPTTVRVTVKATAGDQDKKMGIIASDGTKYMASNTFLAGRLTGTGNVTVLDEWYKDSNVKGSADGNKGLTNNMIGKTFDLLLDDNGYIVGLKQVLESNSSVGVITGVDSKRIGTGKYLSEVEAFMTDGTTQTFCVPKMIVKATGALGTLATSVDPDDDTQIYTFFTSASEAEGVWSTTGQYGIAIGVGSLVKFATVNLGGESYWKIDDYDAYKDDHTKDSDTFTNIKTGTALAAADKLATSLGTVMASEVADDIVETGVTDTLVGTGRKFRMLDDKSVVFVTEYDYRYNAGDENEGGNINMTYKVYNGFKNIPTIETAGQGDAALVYQRLDKNPEYYLIGKNDKCNDYIIKDQATISVDDSYLLLSRGYTYDEYSEYNVLKNGELTTLKVANGNDAVNAEIEKTLTGGANENQLLIVTGRNGKGYVTSVMDIATMAGSGTAAQQGQASENTAGLGDSTITPDAAAAAEDAATVRKHSNSVLQLVGNANGFLTIADGCKVKLVNRDLGTTYDITLNEALRYSNGVDGDSEDSTLPSHGMVFELDQYGYVCALYVIDDWN